MRLYVDISSLRERELTGIGQTVLNLADRALRDREVDDLHFIAGASELPRPLVEDVVGTGNGSLLNVYLASGRAQCLAVDPGVYNAGLFLHRVLLDRSFDAQAVVLYDLTALIVPGYHSSATVQDFVATFRREMDAVDHVLTISDAAHADLVAYFPEYRTKAQASRCGIRDEAFAPSSLPLPAPLGYTPYILSLGTLEPRKNNLLTLEMLARNREFLKHFRFVFVGRHGWGDSVESVIADLGLGDAVEAGTIVFTGFVDERVKRSLIEHSAALLYPSRFEGFGLPILEALAFGKPVVCQGVTSIPEVAGNLGYYFRKSTPDALAMTMLRLMTDLRAGRHDGEQSRAWARQFTWERMWGELKAAVQPGGRS